MFPMNTESLTNGNAVDPKVACGCSGCFLNCLTTVNFNTDSNVLYRSALEMKKAGMIDTS